MLPQDLAPIVLNNEIIIFMLRLNVRTHSLLTLEFQQFLTVLIKWGTSEMKNRSLLSDEYTFGTLYRSSLVERS